MLDRLEVGYNPGVTRGAVAAWGCRAIVRQDGHIVVPSNRQHAVGLSSEHKDELLRALSALGQGVWREQAAALLRSGVMGIGVGQEHELYRGGRIVIIGNTLGSHAYLYVAASLAPAALAEARTDDEHSNGADATTPSTPAAVTVQIENSYECGHRSDRQVQVPLPGPEQDIESWWSEHVHDHTGDGHPCGTSEHALYEVRVLAAPGRPELVGQSTSWEG